MLEDMLKDSDMFFGSVLSFRNFWISWLLGGAAGITDISVSDTYWLGYCPFAHSDLEMRSFRAQRAAGRPVIGGTNPAGDHQLCRATAGGLVSVWFSMGRVDKPVLTHFPHFRG